MKTLSHFNKLLVLVPAATLLAGVPFAGAQVKIEGGPNPVSIADGDNAQEPANPTAIAPGEQFDGGAPLPPIPDRDGALEIQPDPFSSTTVRVPIVEPKKSETTPSAPIAVQRVVVEPEALDPATAARMAELERELGIARSATAAQVAFEADTVFESGSTIIDDLAEPTLAKFAEYLDLYPGKKATVTYRFVAGDETVRGARLKAVEFVEWMAGVPELSGHSFVMEQPAPVTKPVARDAQPGGLETEFAPIVDVVITR